MGLDEKVSKDERIFMLVNPKVPERIGAIGLKLLDRADCLIGLYFDWSAHENPREVLREIVGLFGEARFYAPSQFFEPALVCKMAIDIPSYVALGEKSRDYRKIKIDLLEIRASNPKPFVSLHFNRERNIWDYKPVLSLGCVDSNYSYVPN